MRLFFALMSCLLFVTLAACNSQEDNPSESSVSTAPSATSQPQNENQNEATATPFVRPTLPPTWTPVTVNDAAGQTPAGGTTRVTSTPFPTRTPQPTFEVAQIDCENRVDPTQPAYLLFYSDLAERVRASALTGEFGVATSDIQLVYQDVDPVLSFILSEEVALTAVLSFPVMNGEARGEIEYIFYTDTPADRFSDDFVETQLEAQLTAMLRSMIEEEIAQEAIRPSGVLAVLDSQILPEGVCVELVYQ